MCVALAFVIYNFLFLSPPEAVKTTILQSNWPSSSLTYLVFQVETESTLITTSFLVLKHPSCSCSGATEPCKKKKKKPSLLINPALT